jgi:hypothetical protein
MSEDDLIKSRQVWEALLIAEPPYTMNWQSWADDTMLKCEVPPVWLIDLSLAKEMKAALSIVQESIYTDIKKLSDPLSYEALVLGIVYSFWPEKSGDNLYDLWRRFSEVADIAQFIESRSSLLNNSVSHISKQSYLENTEFIFRPLAKYADLAINEYIGSKYINT